MKKYFYIIILLLLGCKSDIDLAMERGIQFYEWDKLEESILEFKFVIHNLSINKIKLDYKDLKILSRAHHNLAIAYAKKTWYQDALLESQKAFDLIPSDNNRKVMELIKKKIPKK